MGMFDEVKVPCPKCGEINYVQSKAGPCSLGSYEADRVPTMIAWDLDGTLVGCSCGYTFQLDTGIVRSVRVRGIEPTVWGEDD